MLASRRESGPLQKLSHVAPRQEDSIGGGDDYERTIRSEDEVSEDIDVDGDVNLRGRRGRRLGQQVGWRQGDPANMSMRGEIGRGGSSSFL